ncbi:MAG: molybdopterin-dependent oxidoreductase [Alphaproteobacteria bacterium]|nr:molybdopterin-dependent oxidoreductase [Alphaproteobacteria bacterium]
MSTRLPLLTDIVCPSALYGVVLRSPHPHARILALDLAAARAMPGVHAVLSAADIPGPPCFGVRIADQPVLCADIVRCVGDPVVAIAAATRAQALAARDALHVEWQVLPVLDDAAMALAEGAPPLHPAGNLLHRVAHAHGDVAAGFAAAAHVVELRLDTPRQVHAYIENEGALAVPGADGVLTIHAPGHWAEAERSTIAAILAEDASRLRVIASPVGGSFGGKDCLHAQPLAALLARATGRAVRLHWTREESFAIGVKRHPFSITMRSACDAAGRLLAHQVALLVDTGAYAQHGPEVLETAFENVQGPYAWPAFHGEGRLAYTNNGISGAMRGFGAMQVQVALEQQMDALAARLGMCPLRFRQRNLRADAAPGQLGQTLVAPSHAALAAARLTPPPPPRDAGRWRIAHGIALVEKGEGFAQGGPNQGAARLTIEADGRIWVRLGLSELGQGLPEAASIAASRILGCALQDIMVGLGDSATTPDAGPLAASRGAGIAWRAILDARPHFLDAIAARAAALGLSPGLRLGAGGLWREGGNAPEIPLAALAGVAADGIAAAVETRTGHGAVHAAFTACAAEATVALDRVTGRARVLRVKLLPVSGPVLSEAGLRAQMEGCAAMATGFALTEELPAQHGRFRASNLDTYLVPTLADTPQVEVEAIEDIPPDALGPRGVGEIGVNAAAPAIVTALMAALGRPLAALPATAERNLAAWEEA